jgi:hypothetical protein
MPRMSSREYEDTVRYYAFHLFAYPILVCVAIYGVGSVIESLFGFNFGVAKTIFVALGGIGYFVLYFKKQLAL